MSKYSIYILNINSRRLTKSTHIKIADFNKDLQHDGVGTIERYMKNNMQHITVKLFYVCCAYQTEYKQNIQYIAWYFKNYLLKDEITLQHFCFQTFFYKDQ